MVAYSFQQRFRAPILAGTKRQTIRADRKRHAYPGETLQLYTGMRTRNCQLIARAPCTTTRPIHLDLNRAKVELAGITYRTGTILDVFAQSDGFNDWHDLVAFWRDNHPQTPVFSGVLIEWAAIPPP